MINVYEQRGKCAAAAPLDDFSNKKTSTPSAAFFFLVVFFFVIVFFFFFFLSRARVCDRERECAARREYARRRNTRDKTGGARAREKYIYIYFHPARAPPPPRARARRFFFLPRARVQAAAWGSREQKKHEWQRRKVVAKKHVAYAAQSKGKVKMLYAHIALQVAGYARGAAISTRARARDARESVMSINDDAQSATR